MSAVYVYALLGDTPRPDPGAGLGAEPLRVVRVGDVLAAVGDMPERPAVSEAALRGHDAVVRRLAGAVDAILPVRFGALLTEGALADALAARAGELRRALELVAGREQMTLRVFGESAATVKQPAPVGGDVGPGARYLEERRRQWRHAHAAAEIDALRPALEVLVRAERVQRHDAPPLLASVYHLVDRARTADYLAAVEHGTAALAPVRVTATGPWPPYAFAPEALA